MSRRLSRPATGLVVAVAASLTLAACGSSGSGSGSGAYNIGAVLPLSGAVQVYGEQYQETIELGRKYINDELHLKQPIKLHYGDGQGVPAPSVTAMNKLINVNKSQVIFTGFSAPTKAIAPLANRSKVLELNGGASTPDLQGLGDYVYSNVPLANQQIPFIMQYVAGDLGLKKWAVIRNDEVLGDSLLKALKKQAPDAGVELVGEASASITATDFGSQVAKIKKLDPDVIYLANSNAAQTPIIGKQFREAGVDAQFVSYAGFDLPATLKEKAMDGALFTAQKIDYESTDPVTTYFNAAWEKEHPGTSPATLQANYFSLMVIVGDLIAQLEKDGKDFTGENMLAALKKTKTFNVLGGEITFNDDGTVQVPIDIRKTGGGTTNIVKSYEAADVE